MDYPRGSSVNQQAKDKKKAAFKQPSERTKNTPKKEMFGFSFVKPSTEAITAPLPPDPEEDVVSENTNESLTMNRTLSKSFLKRTSDFWDRSLLAYPCFSTSVEEWKKMTPVNLQAHVYYMEMHRMHSDMKQSFMPQPAEHTLYNQYEEKIRPCIDLVDSLRALGVEKDLSLPAIAVIGDQSSGKSSVLEALSGVALPRGNGIVTRCPLELKLKRLREGQAWQGKISYRNVTLELKNASEVDRAIRKAQDVVAGPRGAISKQLISLEVRSPDVPDLTLIDLPGIARVAVGEQPKDIGDQIKTLLKGIIGCKETVNLVVVPCNVDIATTEALKMAQEVDPTGERTIGILTKPDLVDRGTEETIVKILQNRVIPLKKGYMIVKCRGQQDIHNNMTLAAAIQQERNFFENHKHFRAIMDEGKATIPCLAEKLTNELVKHIIKTLPALESQIRDILHKTIQDLQRYNRGTPQTESEKLFFLTDLIKLFNHEISQTTRGEEELFGDEVRLFSKIRKEFCSWGVTLLECASKAEKNVPSRVWKYEDQYRGREFPGFSNYRTFEDIIKDQIRELEQPAIQILYNVMELVEEKFMDIAKRNFANFHNLSRAAKVKIEDIREKQAVEAERHIRAQFKMEKIVYCQDNLYLSDLNTVKGESACNAASNRNLQFFSPNETSVVGEMVSHTIAYFSGASKRLSNQIPLIILSSVLHDFGENIQTSMLQLLQDKEKLNFLLEEDTEAAKIRNYLGQRVDRLTQACQYLRNFSLM